MPIKKRGTKIINGTDIDTTMSRQNRNTQKIDEILGVGDGGWQEGRSQKRERYIRRIRQMLWQVVGRKAAARKGKGIFEGSGRCCGRWLVKRLLP